MFVNVPRPPRALPKARHQGYRKDLEANHADIIVLRHSSAGASHFLRNGWTRV